MRGKAFRHDMTMMFAIHDALRRDLERLARVAARTDDDPWHILRVGTGWDLFRRYLRVHLGAEDDLLWPVMRRALADRPDELGLIAVMEAEHATFEPLLHAIDAALADHDTGRGRLGDLLDGLVSGLRGHLEHEEDEALPLIDAVVTAEQMHRFGAEHGRRVGSGTCRYLPWLLDHASAENAAIILGQLPESIRPTYLNLWQPAYAAQDPWGARGSRRTARRPHGA
ncbi:hemerythrin domain-containing protein [Embleya sp. NPDC008237]|uniref:hemerythrin domain-containing protein n=1 Tax=Embleya sp. NPDC008237 TaxID=3363978 RepID=UPI0036EABC55